jgi:cell division protein FtsQ
VTSPVDVERPPERGGRKWKLFAFVVLLILLAPASWLARKGASRLEFFHVRSVSVEGTRYLSPDTVMARLALDTMRSVWDDTRPLEDRLRRMSQVTDVRISRRLPGTLVVRIRENVPVALAPSPRGLEALDTAGIVLPIDPSRSDLDLPVSASRDASILATLGRIRSDDPALYRRISEIARSGKSELVLQLVALSGTGTLRVRIPAGVSVSRLADIFPVESDLVRRRANVAELDLRFRDQVIARLQ